MQVAIRVDTFKQILINSLELTLGFHTKKALTRIIKELLNEQHLKTKQQCMAELSKLKGPHGTLAVACAHELVEGVKLV
jgi:hypothetical protein